MLQQIFIYFQVLWVTISSLFVGWGLVPNQLTVEPTVFVAENEYQIVWETRRPSAAWVVVDGEQYTDNLGGYMYWDQTVHKVRVPIDKLNSAGGYEIHWQHVMRAEWVVRKGNHNVKEYRFRAPDFGDGLQVYNISDSHSSVQPFADIASYWGDDLDLLILNGDIVHDITYSWMRTDVMKLAWEITRGERPVLYARGNHETRGAYANDFHRYAGTPDGDRWYFTTRLGPLWIAVYDAAEDKLDEHQENNGLADFERYRERETDFFGNVIANAAAEFDAPGVEYRLLVSHIPVGDGTRAYTDVMARWLEQANQMKIDLAIAGHTHSLRYYAPDTFGLQGAFTNYPVITGTSPSARTATALEFKPGSIQAWFTDQNRRVTETLPEIIVR